MPAGVCLRGGEEENLVAATRELRYNNRNAVYGNLAYDLDREVREHELRHAGEAQRRQEAVRERPKIRSLSKAQVRQRQKISILSVLGVGAAIGLSVLVLLYYIQLTTISDEVVALQHQLAELKTENVSLTAQHEQMFDLATVKEVAEAAGMSKPGSSQVYYIDMSEGDSAVVYQQEEGIASRLLTSLNHGIYAVVEYFE